MRPPPDNLVLGFYPTSRGFGWAAFGDPFTPFDWGLVYARGDRNSACLARMEWLLDRLQPTVLVLEAFDRATTKRASRISRLSLGVTAAAAMRNIEVVVYPFAEVQAAFGEVEARTRHDIAEAVVRHVDAFRHRLPPRRRPWESEDRRMALFAAAALVLTYFRDL